MGLTRITLEFHEDLTFGQGDTSIIIMFLWKKIILNDIISTHSLFTKNITYLSMGTAFQLHKFLVGSNMAGGT